MLPALTSWPGFISKEYAERIIEERKQFLCKSQSGRYFVSNLIVDRTLGYCVKWNDAGKTYHLSEIEIWMID